ncbi:hypothetical protein [Campylobacter sp. CCUG 57310]|uniref:hypothetical protein n=1 Tax=Campylobacter sp. CCUG 57310 TaxID=2517362 RepID=UPI001563D057|nr:hypothetical protein [Campylobacter sp. CCUG 57310]
MIFLVIISSNAFAEWIYEDKNGLKHTIENVEGSKYKDINAEKTLTQRTTNSRKIYGDIETIGATILIPEENQPGGGGFHYIPDSTTQNGSSVVKDFKYIQEDGGVNSAKATFNFTNKYVSENIDADKIIFARLYWGGGFSKRWNYTDIDNMLYYYLEEIKDFNTVTFKTPDGKTHNLKAEGDQNIKWYGSYSERGMQFMYQASADVTQLVKDSIGKGKTFSAGNIKTTTKKPPSIGGFRDNGWSYGLYAPHYGGWALSIIYDFGPNEGTRAKLKPRGVYVYDGLAILAPIHLNKNQNSRTDTLPINVSGFFTPASGKVNSNLTVLSFGAKKEVGSENIKIKRESDKKFYAVTSAQNNPEGQQFNSTITRFDKHMDPNKVYNNQMDLDIFDLADHMSHKQTSTDIELTAQVIRGRHYTYGERANIGLVAFSTELYIPEVCYIEELYHRSKNKTEESDFKEVSKNASSRTEAKSGDTLRVKLTILNRGNEDALKVAIGSELNEKSIKHIPDTTFVKPNADAKDAFIVSESDKQGDNNANFFKKQDNKLKFFVGKGASSGDGGTLNKENKAFIQYDTTLEEKFEQNSYSAKFENKEIGLHFEGAINKCDNTNYHLIIIKKVLNKVVNKNFNNLGDSENTFTQLAGRSFDAKLINFNITEGKNLANFDLENNIVVDAVDNATDDVKCKTAPNIMQDKKIFTSKDLEGKSIIDVKNILINEAYQRVYFRISYVDKNNKVIQTSCSSDPFSVRPKELKFYNSKNGTTNFGNLVGGKGYTNIWLQAVNNNNQITKTYSTVVNPINFSRSSAAGAPNKTDCPDSNFAFQNQTTLEADFKDGKGELKRVWDGAGKIFAPEHGTNFVYPNVGHVLIEAKDKKWTITDQTEDCIVDNDTITENSEGKIGCDISARNDLNLLFVPNDISINNLQILNFNNGAMTYLSGDATGMEATANFNITARLADNANTTATLYTRGCYARNVTFTTSIVGDVSDFTDLQGKAINDPSDRTAAVLQNILYFNQEIQDPDDSKKIINSKVKTTIDNNGAYFADKRFFLNGTAPYTVRFNFARDIRFARNPFRITSNNFTFNNISDTDSVAGAPYAAPLNVTNADFYYGRVYAPDYEGPATGFNANVYYGIFCNGCNPAAEPNRYPLVNATSQTLPQTTSWFINTAHTAIQGRVTAYQPTLNTTTVTPDTTTPTIKNGIEQIRLSSTAAPAEDTIRMSVPQWLLFNPVDVTALTNNFNVKFYGNVIRWGGRSLNKDKQEVGVGKIVGGGQGDMSDRFDNISEKTNKRLNW